MHVGPVVRRAEGKALIHFGVSVDTFPTHEVMHDPGTFLPTATAAHRQATAQGIREIGPRHGKESKAWRAGCGNGDNYTAARRTTKSLEVFRIAANANASVHVIAPCGIEGATTSLVGWQEVIADAAASGARCMWFTLPAWDAEPHRRC